MEEYIYYFSMRKLLLESLVCLYFFCSTIRASDCVIVKDCVINFVNIEPNINQTKPNLPNRTYRTKPTKPNLSNQTHQTSSD